MKNKVICIGREFGSGGHEIAVLLGQKLGLKVYEKDILHMACKYGDLQVSRMESADEKATNPYLFETVHEGNYHVARGLPTSEVLFQLQRHEIQRIAAKESCIIVGRCADFVLKEAEVSLLSVFITAPEEYRTERKMEQEKLSRMRAKHLVRHMDQQRRKYYEHFTKESWGKPERYDLYIDSSRQSMDDIVLLIRKYYEELE